MIDNNSHTASSSSFPPSDWVETTLGKAINLRQGKYIPSSLFSKEINSKRKFSIFGGGGVRGYSDFFEYEKPQVIITCRGSGCGLIQKTKQNSSITNSSIAFEVDENFINRNFIFYWASGKDFSDVTTGSAQPQITISALSKKEILLPPLLEQQAIASVLSAFDDKIELLREQNKTLEEMGQVIFQEWFEKYGVEDELPEGWRVGKLGEAGKQITARVKNQENRQVLSAVNTGNLVLSEDYFTKQVFSKTLEKYIICEPGDFAYNPARINIGSIGRNNNNVFGAVSPVYVVFRPNEKIGRYLEFILKSKDFNRHVEKFANGSVRQALNYDGFSRFEILIPGDEILEEFNEIILDFDNKINFNNSQIQSLARTRDELLPKLMRGEVRVNDFSNN